MVVEVAIVMVGAGYGSSDTDNKLCDGSGGALSCEPLFACQLSLREW